MASLREIRRRIKSVENINNITKAMQIISAVRYKKVDDHFKKALPFYETVERLTRRIMTTSDLLAEHPLFVEREVRKTLLIVTTGDRGLCGGFNANILKSLAKYLRENPDKEMDIFPIGKVGEAFVTRRKLPVFDSWINIGYQFTAESLAEKFQKIIDAYQKGRYDEVRVLSMVNAKGGSQKVLCEKFLGLSYLFDMPSKEKECDYIFEPDSASVLKSLIDLYLKQRFFIFLLRSVTAEYFARMIAMKQATDNGRDLVDLLRLDRNKVRQAMITSEISEIIGGVNALAN